MKCKFKNIQNVKKKQKKKKKKKKKKKDVSELLVYFSQHQQKQTIPRQELTFDAS
jgi:hypothetical protein